MISRPESSLEETIARLRTAGFDTDDFIRTIEMDRANQTAISAEASVANLTMKPLTPLAVAAATRGAFLPSDLTTDVETDKASIAEIISLSEVLSTGSERIWQLRPEARRDILAQARHQGFLSDISAVAQAPGRHDREGPMLRRVLAGEQLDLDLLELEELEQLTTVAEWLAGSDLAQPAALAPAPDLRRLIARRAILDPFRLLVGRTVKAGSDGSEDRVVGRSAHTERLRAYVGMREPEELKHYVTRTLDSMWSAVTLGKDANQPLLVRGIGGMGKSTLIGKFVLDHALFAGVELPFAYLDFDRAALAPRQPLQLLIEIAVQLGLCLTEAEPELSRYRTNLRQAIDDQARNFNRRQREGATSSGLHSHCDNLRNIVERFNNRKAPVLILFDTYEIVQYDEEAIAGVNALIDALRMPEMREWSALRLVIAGRGELADIVTPLKPVDLKQLSLVETREFLRSLSQTESLGLTNAHIAALAPALRNSPLDVVVVANWLKGQDSNQRAPLLSVLIEGIEQEINNASQSKDDWGTEEGSELLALRITGILVRRMIEHIVDPEVRKLALPGLVVRTITPDIIREVMAPASGLCDAQHPLRAGAEHELFRRLGNERWLVTRQGTVLRHRPEVRRAMLALMRGKDPSRFDAANALALQRFRAQAEEDEIARSETIYHMLLGERTPLETVDALWTTAMARPLAGAEDDLSGPAQDYLKARLGRSVALETLAGFPQSILRPLIAASRGRLLQRLGPEHFLNLLTSSPGLEEVPELQGLRYEAIYRSGRWAQLREALYGRGRGRPQIPELMRELERGSVHEIQRLGHPDLRSLCFVLRWATRDAGIQKKITGMTKRFAEASDARAGMMDIPDIALDFATWVAVGQSRGFELGLQPVMECASALALSAKRLPAAAAGSDALRILSFFEMTSDRPVLGRVDFENHFATFSSREAQVLAEVLRVADPEVSGSAVPRAGKSRFDADMLARGLRLLDRLPRSQGDFVIADAEITREFATVVRACAGSGSPALAEGTLRLLACRHPDWLEPLGHALTRAFGGEVPTRIGWLSTIDKYVGGSERARKAKQSADGYAILSLADEASLLPEAVDAYLGLLKGRRSAPDASDFVVVSEAFHEWSSMLDRLVAERASREPFAFRPIR